MDTVPVAFCSSVCKFLRDSILPELEKRSSKAWSVASSEVKMNQVNIFIHFRYANGEWKYRLDVSVPDEERRGITIEELKRIDRRNLQVHIVTFDEWRKGDTAASLDEIFEIMNFTKFSLNQPIFELREGIGEYPEEALSRMLSFYRNGEFPILEILHNHRLAENFLITQLHSSEVLQWVTLQLRSDRFSEDVRAAVEEYALSKNFRFITILEESWVFEIAFFERFFEKTMEPNSKCTIMAPIAYTFAELKEFRTELQMDVADAIFPVQEGGCSERFIVWRRNDGVQVTAKRCTTVWMITIQRGQ